MDRGLMIRRLHSIAQAHAWDGAFVLLLLAVTMLAGQPALAGLARFAAALSPGIAAQAADRQEAATQLAVKGFPASGPYAPQLLYPVQDHGAPVWLRNAPQDAAPPLHPVIAICIDDLGEDLAGTDRAMALSKNVALSFLPYAQSTPFLATEAARKGHEILAHVPMEAVGQVDPGPMALKVGAPDNVGRLFWNIAQVPGLIGINNHEGSKFTTDAASLTPVIQAVAARHLLFFDSRTIAGSRVVEIAHAMGVVSAGRDIFLDDTPDEATVRKQLAALTALARKQGVAIAIGHPHDVTLSVLGQWLAQDHGVTLVPLSEAIALKSAHARMASR
jgi:polysaccharide deacetylase 2 family uncharacterized protein YibQ